MQNNPLIKFSSEDEEQAKVFEWAEVAKGQYPCLRFMYHTPNEGKRSKGYGQILKRIGMKSGVPDICLPAPAGGFHGLYIEMKFNKNKPTKEQTAYMEYLKSAGFFVKVCYSGFEAISVIDRYLKEEIKNDY